MYSLAATVDPHMRKTAMANAILDAIDRHRDYVERNDDLDERLLSRINEAKDYWKSIKSSLLDGQCITFATSSTRCAVERIFGFYFRRTRPPLSVRLDNCTSQKEVDEVLAEEEFMEKMIKISRQKSKHELSWRLLCHVERRARQNVKMVFNTLTIRNDVDPEVALREGFNDYIEKFDTATGIQVHGSRRKAHRARKEPEGWYHDYFAVVERGGKSSRLHVHVLHFCRELPRGCVDPNSGRVGGKRRIIDGLRNYWQYGFSMPIAVRFSFDDGYGKLNWAWPSTAKRGRPGSIASYLTKYIEKSLTDQKRGVRSWRTRTSLNFGLEPIQEVMRRLEEPTLLALSQLEMTSPEMRLAGRRCPIGLIRKSALREYLQRQTLSSKVLLLRRLKPAESILRLWRNLTDVPPAERYRKLKYGLASTEIFMAPTHEDISETIDAFISVNKEYFPPAFTMVGTYDARLSPGRL